MALMVFFLPFSLYIFLFPFLHSLNKKQWRRKSRREPLPWWRRCGISWYTIYTTQTISYWFPSWYCAYCCGWCWSGGSGCWWCIFIIAGCIPWSPLWIGCGGFCCGGSCLGGGCVACCNRLVRSSILISFRWSRCSSLLIFTCNI